MECGRTSCFASYGTTAKYLSRFTDPSIEKHVEARRYTSKVNRTTKRGLRQFSAGNPVLARNYGKGEKWVPGVVTEVVCSRHCMV